MAVQARDVAGSLYRRGRLRELTLLTPSEADANAIAWYEASVPVHIITPTQFQSSGISRVVEFKRFFSGRTEPILHFHCFSQDFMDWRLMLAAKLAGKKVVVTLHHTVAWLQKKRMSLFGQRIGWRCVDRFVVTTNAGKSLVAQRIPEKKLIQIACGVPKLTTRFSREQARKALSIEPDEFVIVCVCRIMRHKGIFDLVESVKRISVNHRKVRLLLVGSGRDSAAVADCIKGVSNIVLLGQVDNAMDVLVAADVYCMPSYEEGFGLVYAEAAAFGIPSIASNLPTVSEVVLQGETGWLVTPGNPVELDDAILKAMSDKQECARRGIRAHEHCQQYNIEIVVDRLEGVYDALI
jgi:glycosyltransferase involved in cell wall biosynthesis